MYSQGMLSASCQMHRGDESRHLPHSILFPQSHEIFSPQRWRFHAGLTLCLLWLNYPPMRSIPLSRGRYLPAHNFFLRAPPKSHSCIDGQSIGNQDSLRLLSMSTRYQSQLIPSPWITFLRSFLISAKSSGVHITHVMNLNRTFVHCFFKFTLTRYIWCRWRTFCSA